MFKGPDGPFEVVAKSVILATGGFEWNSDLVRAFTRGPLTHPVSIQTNTGDGLKMAMRAGAMLGNMREAWWMPVIEVPTDINPMGRQLLTYERTMPGSLMVNRAGRRFTNEAANYNAFGAAFHEQDVSRFTYANLPCWLIFNQAFYAKWPFVGGLGDSFDQNAKPPQWIPAAATLAELAGRLGIDAEGLAHSVARFNEQAEAGSDPDFQRGESANDVWWGDPAFRGDKRATLGALGPGPYYAVEVKSGALGTKGGPQTDIDARVLDVDLNPIIGLYAAGNVMASPMGMTYGGGGGTLGPGMVFGYRAGLAAAKQNRTESC
jgi:3-oxosteroid 1-dehydrogenase